MDSNRIIFISFVLFMMSITSSSENNFLAIVFGSYCFRLIGWSFVFLSLFVKMFYDKIKVDIFPFILLLLMIFILQIYRCRFDFDDIIKVVMLAPFLLLNRIETKSLPYKKSLGILLFLLYVIYGLFMHNEKFGLRLNYSSSDPNMSAIIVLIAFMFASKVNSKFLEVGFSVLGFLTQSRNFMLAIFVFYLVRFLKRSKLFYVLFGKIRIIPFYVVLNIVFTLFVSFFILSMDEASGRDTFSFNDGSNRLRFLYALEGLDYVDDVIVDGAGYAYWPVSKDGTGLAEVSGRVHNSLIDLIIIKGVFYSLIYLMIFSCYFKYKYVYYNYEYIFSYLVASFFVGELLFSTVYVCSWLFVLSLSSNNLKEYVDKKNLNFNPCFYS